MASQKRSRLRRKLIAPGLPAEAQQQLAKLRAERDWALRELSRVEAQQLANVRREIEARRAKMLARFNDLYKGIVARAFAGDDEAAA